MNRLFRFVLCLGSLQSCQGLRTIAERWNKAFWRKATDENIEMDYLNPVKDGVIVWIDPEDSEVRQNVTETTISCELRTQDNMAMFLHIDRRTGKKMVDKVICPIINSGKVSAEHAVEYFPDTVNSDPREYDVLVLQYHINHAELPPITDDNMETVCFDAFHKIFDFYADRVPIVIPHEPDAADEAAGMLQMEELTPITVPRDAQSQESVRAPVARLNRLNREICQRIESAEALPEELQGGTYWEGVRHTGPVKVQVSDCPRSPLLLFQRWKLRQVHDRKYGRLKCTIAKKQRWLGSQTEDVDFIIAEDVMRISVNRGGKKVPVRLNDALLAKLRRYEVLSKDEEAPRRCEVFIKGMHRHITKDETLTDTPTHTDTQGSPVYSDTVSSSTDSQGSSSYADSLKAVFDYIMEHVP